MDNGAIRETTLRVLARVAETQQDLMSLLVELGHQDGQRESDVVLWEQLLDLAATVKSQVLLLRTLTGSRASAPPLTTPDYRPTTQGRTAP